MSPATAGSSIDQHSSSSSSKAECVSGSSTALEAVGLLPGLDDWSKDSPKVNLQGCEECYEIEQLRTQFGDLCTQYQTLCTAYNQIRRDLDSQFQEMQSLSLSYNIEKTNRMDADIRCQTLKNELQAAEGNKVEATGQYMAIIAKLTDILHASPSQQ